jgi:hypothetical protein
MEDSTEDKRRALLLQLLIVHQRQTILLAAVLCNAQHERKQRRLFYSRRSPSLFLQRLQWNNFCELHGHRAEFKRHLRMTHLSFTKLLASLRLQLEVNQHRANQRGGAILPEICLYVCIRFLAGGSYSDIRFFTGLSVASFYRVVWKTIHAINNMKGDPVAASLLGIKFPSSIEEAEQAAQGFQSISTQGCIWNCVAVVDGYHLQITTPSKKEAKNVRSFFSGHYQTYGINVQASCDHNCKFTFIGVAGPGVLGDREAIRQIPLFDLIEKLPGLFCAIGDCAYTPTEHLVPIFRGDQAKFHKNDNFNFFASQLRIRIEMAFGLMVKKWGIIGRPLNVKLANVKHIVLAIARLHNYCINERLLQKEAPAGNQLVVFTPTNVAFDLHSTMLRDEAAVEEFEEMASEFVSGRCQNRDRMVGEIQALQLTRPGMEGRSGKINKHRNR